MKIFINEKYEIKAINSSEDTSLVEIEVDREFVFGDMSDFMILNYCYKQDENGYSIYPSRNYGDILEEDYRLKVDESQKKISILFEQNDHQEEIIASLTYELMMLQEPMVSSTLINNHSPKYNLIKSWFNKGYWNEEMLLNAVKKHYITEEEMNEIIG